jgi:hypothetical protein
MDNGDPMVRSLSSVEHLASCTAFMAAAERAPESIDGWLGENHIMAKCG